MMPGCHRSNISFVWIQADVAKRLIENQLRRLFKFNLFSTLETGDWYHSKLFMHHVIYIPDFVAIALLYAHGLCMSLFISEAFNIIFSGSTCYILPKFICHAWKRLKKVIKLPLSISHKMVKCGRRLQKNALF